MTTDNDWHVYKNGYDKKQNHRQVHETKVIYRCFRLVVFIALSVSHSCARLFTVVTSAIRVNIRPTCVSTQVSRILKLKYQDLEPVRDFTITSFGMKLDLSAVLWAFRISSPMLALVVVLCAFHGVNCVEPDSKKEDSSSLNPTKKIYNNGNGHRSGLPLECPEKDEKCETDRQGLEAIRSLHLLIDDDHNGNVDQHESDEFLRDELQYTDGFERQALFHNNDKLISVDDLWRAWKYSTVHNWTVEDVQEWLVQDVDLPQYAGIFASNNIDGSVLPRLVNSTSTLMMALNIRNMHKQRLALKAMDAVLFGAPKRVHSFTKDLLLVSSLILAVGGCWFACLHHRYSQTQVKKMMKDLESLQKAEDALKKLSNELADAEKNQSSLSQEKQEELRMLRQSSVRLKVPLVPGGDKSPNTLSREGSALRRQEGEKKLKKAEEELSALREALSEAETRLELHQQLESQWSVPGELQAWLQLTHELEMQQHSLKKQAAERQRLAARDGCDKIKKRNKAFFGSLRIAHSNSLDDIEQSIMDARAALEEVRQDLQESQQRWQIMEILCGFPIIVNPGLTALRQALGRDATGNVSRGTGSLLTPGSIDEAEEDLQPAASRKSRDSSGEASSIYNQIPERQRQQIVAWARRSRLNNWMRKKTSSPLTNGFTACTLPSSGKSSTFLKQQAMAGSTSSLPHASTVGGGTVTGVAAAVATLPRRDSRDTDIMLNRTTECVVGTAMGSSTNATTFHLGPLDSSIYQAHERTHSNASISMISPMMSNGHHHHAQHHHQQHLRTSYSQVLSHPPFHLHSNASSPHVLAVGSSTGSLSTGGLNPNGMIPHRASTSKLFTSPSGNHLSGMKQVSPSSAITAAHGNKNGVGAINGHSNSKHHTNSSAGVTSRQESLDSNGYSIGYTSDSSVPGSATGADTPPVSGIPSRPQAQSTPADNTDRMSLDSVTRGGHSMTARSRLDRTIEVDVSSLDTDSMYSNGMEAGTEGLNHSHQDRSPTDQASITPPGGNTLEKKSSKRKKFLPNFLQKGKGKQKTS
ncbi:hypothetical protein RRG08_048971 [Elysia crispata]|uniref:SAM domain-containing protein n=1 Tax=Elysia crispata TaxID=231223 RepID=A0AAE0YCU0_9GAST|nr:hypothetical protein RRG08_048971 [Elysia crispata]